MLEIWHPIEYLVILYIAEKWPSNDKYFTHFQGILYTKPNDKPEKYEIHICSTL